MAAVKVLVAVSVLLACLAVIYPRLSLLLPALGVSESMSPENQIVAEGIKPAQVNAVRSLGSTPHPGIRTAADMQKHQAQPGSGRGIMGLILPIYAIGIVLYLVYMLFKVFNKSKKDSRSQIETCYDNRGGKDVAVDRMGFPLDYDGSGDVHNFLNDHQQKRELEELLARVDNQHVSVNEMRLLQKRLEETESQMSRILMAMQTVQTNVDRMDGTEDGDEAKIKPNDMSPDMESYEVVGREEEMDEDVEDKNNVTRVKHEEKEEDFERTDERTEIKTHSEKLAHLSNAEVDFDGVDKDSNEVDDVQEEKKKEASYDEEIKKNIEDASNESVDADSSLR